MKINLVEIAGEFCTSRKSPSLRRLREMTEACLAKGELIEISRQGVKVLTPSFIDEWLPELVIKYGDETFAKYVKFSPPLEGYAEEQLQRGVRARRGALLRE